jgi:hypothetical protein
MNDPAPDRDIANVWFAIRRRKVVQWGVASAAAALVLLQVLDYFSGTFDWPRQIQQLTTVALLIGLPVALILACYHGAAAEAYARRILKAANSAGDTLACGAASCGDTCKFEIRSRRLVSATGRNPYIGRVHLLSSCNRPGVVDERLTRYGERKRVTRTL